MPVQWLGGLRTCLQFERAVASSASRAETYGGKEDTGRVRDGAKKREREERNATGERETTKRAQKHKRQPSSTTPGHQCVGPAP